MHGKQPGHCTQGPGSNATVQLGGLPSAHRQEAAWWQARRLIPAQLELGPSVLSFTPRVCDSGFPLSTA